MAHLTTPLLLSLLLLTTAHGLSPRPKPRPGGTTVPKPPSSLPGPAQDFLDAHNQARAEVGVGPLQWSPTLANATARVVTYQRLKNNCQFANLNSDTNKYGANQLWARGTVVSPRMVVGSWVAEKKFYNYAKNTCAANHQCGVYKQVVWRKSMELGCAQASCAKDGSTLTVCFYNPPGNIVGDSPY